MLSSLALGAAFGPVFAEDRPAWNLTKTWVFAVGVIQFDDPSVTSWPDEGRVDAELIQTLVERGVPTNQILFLKNQEATQEKIAQRFTPFLKRAGKEDTLLFYYAGHGSRNYSKSSRPCTFMTYDTASRWEVDSIFAAVDQHFQGRQVIYTADCCHSGVLVDGAAKQWQQAGALTSAHVASTSTGNWTFTRCLVDMFEGDPLLDRDGSGQITFTEAAQHITGEMAFVEGQYAASATTGGFPADTVMSTATGRRTPRMGQLIEGESKGKWWKAQILDEKDGAVFVTWPGWGKKYDEWLPLERTRPYQPKTFAVGRAVQAEWRKHWYDARVLKVELGLHLIHYEGFADTDDEWVCFERLREPAK